MNINDFTKEIVQEIGQRNQNFTVSEYDATKNNGVKEKAIVIRNEEETVSPVCYLDPYYELFERKEKSMEEIVDHILSLQQKLNKPADDIVNEILCPEDSKSKLRIRLVNYDKNKERIENEDLTHYHIPNTDLVALFHLEVIWGTNETGNILLTQKLANSLFKDYNIEELFDVVNSNIDKKEIHIDSLFSYVEKVLGIDDIKSENMNTPNIYILSNESMVYGAGIVLSEKCQELLREKIGEKDIILIPSSVHELLILDDDQISNNIKELKEMVILVNSTEVSDKDFLSDNIYRLNLSSGMIYIEEGEECDDKS